MKNILLLKNLQNVLIFDFSNPKYLSSCNLHLLLMIDFTVWQLLDDEEPAIKLLQDIEMIYKVFVHKPGTSFFQK